MGLASQLEPVRVERLVASVRGGRRGLACQPPVVQPKSEN